MEYVLLERRFFSGKAQNSWQNCLLMHRKNRILIKKSKLIKVLTARQVGNRFWWTETGRQRGWNMKKETEGCVLELRGTNESSLVKPPLHIVGEKQKYLLARQKRTWKWWKIFHSLLAVGVRATMKMAGNNVKSGVFFVWSPLYFCYAIQAGNLEMQVWKTSTCKNFLSKNN